jgi:hypothetical protein
MSRLNLLAGMWWFGAAAAAAGAFAVWWVMGGEGAEDGEERTVRTVAAELRRRLHITHRDGFVLRCGVRAFLFVFTGNSWR